MATRNRVEVGGVAAEPGEKRVGYLTVLERPASAIRMPVVIINSRRPGPCVVMTAGIHGSEYPGMEAAMRLGRRLEPAGINGTLVVFPLVNVPGFEAAEANVNPLDGLNLNRVFPGDPHGSPSQVLAHRLLSEVSRLADYVIDMHGGDAIEWLDPFAIYYVSGNDEVDRRSARMAELYDTKHIWISGGGQGHTGTFTGALTARGIPSVVGEAGFMATYREEEIAHHIRGVTNILKEVGVLAGEPELTRQGLPRYFRRSFTVTASRGGILYPEAKPSQDVREGELLARIGNLEGEVVEELRSPANGVIRTLFPKRVVGTGDMVYRGWVLDEAAASPRP